MSKLEGTQVLGMTGLARHGKDTVAGHARDRGYRRYAFADNVRRSLWALNPVVYIDRHDYGLLDPDFDGVANVSIYCDPLSGLFVRVRDLVNALGGTDDDRNGSGPGWDRAKQTPEVRALLQRQGTEAVRDIVDEQAWVMALERQLREERPERAVISDVRFPNEAEAIREWGGETARVVRVNEDRSPYDNGLDLLHPSEAHVRSLPVQFELVAFDMAELEDEANDMLDRLDAAYDIDVYAQREKEMDCV